MLKRIEALIVAIVLAFTAPAAIAQDTHKTGAAARAPRLALPEPVRDFGTVPKGQTIDWSFAIRNVGDADLVIAAARPHCGCTVVDFDRLIRPGQTGKVTAHVDTTAFAGPIAKSVTLETNDPDSPVAEVVIHAVVKPYVEAHPAGFVRFNLLQGDAEKQAVTLSSEEPDPFEIVSIQSPTDWIKVEKAKLTGAAALPNVGRAGQSQYRVDITVGGPDAKIGPIAEKIRVLTNSKHQPEYLVSVSGVIRPTFRVDPIAINFGEVAASDAAATRMVVLRSNNLKTPGAFVVTKAICDVAGVTTVVKPTANKGEYEVVLQLAPSAPAGPFGGAVKIYTNDPIHPVVSIPIKGVAKPAS